MPSVATPNSADNQYVNLFDLAHQEQAAPPATGGPPEGLDFLRNSPQFQQLQQLVQSQPHLLQPLLQQLGQSNPQLLQLISNNPDEFMRVIGLGAPGAPGAAPLAGDMETEGAESEELAPEPYITVTPEENEAINRVILN
jgi:UV excision repair protein RAD23